MTEVENELQPELSKLATKNAVQRSLIHQLLEDSVDNSTEIAMLKDALNAANNQHVIDALQNQVKTLMERVNQLTESNTQLIAELNELQNSLQSDESDGA